MESELPLPNRVTINLSKLFLDPQNPRFEPVKDEREAILALCKTEDVLAVADSIASDGLNPLEITAVTEHRIKSGAGTGSYIVREGNRRIAALKLILDPKLAPTDQQAAFRKLSSKNVPKSLEVMLFDSIDDVKPWIRLLHRRDNNPASRRSWKPDQQAREFGDTRNAQALNLLTLAQKEGWIAPEKSKRKTSIIERWTKNKIFKDFVGVDFDAANNVILDKSNTIHVDRLKDFFSKVSTGKINTRSNKKDIEAWVGLSAENPKKDVSSNSPGPSSAHANTNATRPSRPVAPTYTQLPHNKDIADALSRLGNQKLITLYYELCSTRLDSVQLLYIGWWSFVTTLHSVVKNAPSDDFAGFLTSDRLAKLGISDKDNRKHIVGKIRSLASDGNVVKHSVSATSLNGQELYNIVQTIDPVVLNLILVINNELTPHGSWP